MVSQVSGKAKAWKLGMFSGAVKDVRLLIMEWEFHEPQWKMLGRKATMGCWIRQED